MTSSRSWGSYDENEVHALIDNYLGLRYLKHRPSIHVRLMDLEVAIGRLPRPLFEAVLVYGLLRFTSRAAGEALALSDYAVRKRYREGVEHILYSLNGEDE
jgi:hypothetical protein